MTRLALPIFQVDTSQTDLPTALQLMSGLSRNRFVVDAQDAQAQLLGSVEVKGGMVLQAEAGELQGREAVFALLKLRPQTLTAFHVQGGELGEPLGSLDRLLMEGTVAIDERNRAPGDRIQEPAPVLPGLSVVDTGDSTPAVTSPTPAAAETVRRPWSSTLPWVLVAVAVVMALVIGLLL